MVRSSITNLLLLLGTTEFVASSQAAGNQVVFGPSTDRFETFDLHGLRPEAHAELLQVVQAHKDPVDAYLALRPEAAEELAEPRLLHVLGEPEPKWMTNGDKMRLRRKEHKFMDVTDYQDMYTEQLGRYQAKRVCDYPRVPPAHFRLTWAPELPDLRHHRLIKPLFPQISTQRMHDVLKHLTSYYNRYYGGVTGEHSAQWLHDHVAEIIAESPFHTHISLEFFTHVFPQPSIIARFEPKVRNWTHPLTILGAHQDSANYLFPLLPAPGADDDCSGSVSILEAFRVLAHSGFIPKDGPVEFHWYAAEEGGLLGSQAVARYKKDSNAVIGAMMEFDMTAYIARNSTESIGFIKTQADDALTYWALKLAKEYISIESDVYELGPNAGSDYMSYTKLNYPAAFASEGDPMHGGFPGDYDPYVHTSKDTMDVNDTNGYFSIDHMARFSELAIAFVVEQAGWDNSWR